MKKSITIWHRLADGRKLDSVRGYKVPTDNAIYALFGGDSTDNSKDKKNNDGNNSFC